MLYNDHLNKCDSFSVIKTNIKNDKLYHKQINLSDMDLSKRSIIMLCGNDTRDPIKASNYAKHNFNWLKNYHDRDNLTIYSLYYPTIQPLNTDFTLNRFFNYDELSETLINKIFYDNNGILTVEQIIENLSKISFVGHSIGGQVMNELIYAIINNMNKEEFSHFDITKVCKNIVFVGYAPYIFVEAPINGIYITPLHDSVGSTKLAFDKMVKHKNITFSNPAIDLETIQNNIYSYHNDFVNAYRQSTHNENILLAKYKNSMVAIPELMFYNPYNKIMEDHNLAGAVHYPAQNPYKTLTGNIITSILDNILTYIVSTKRQNFSISNLYNMTLDQLEQSPNETSKEL